MGFLLAPALYVRAFSWYLPLPFIPKEFLLDYQWRRERSNGILKFETVHEELVLILVLMGAGRLGLNTSTLV